MWSAPAPPEEGYPAFDVPMTVSRSTAHDACHLKVCVIVARFKSLAGTGRRLVRIPGVVAAVTRVSGR